MARPASSHPTELELAILAVIWRDGPSNARHIVDALAPDRIVVITLTHATLRKMVTKGFLKAEGKRRANGGITYRARVKKASTTLRMLEGLAKRLVGGSLATAIHYLVKEKKINSADLKSLREIVDARFPEGRR